MKSKILKDYQLDCFKKKFNLNNDNITLYVNYEKKNAYYVLDGLDRFDIDYEYAIFYF